jgi:hypothetical protein
MAITKRWKRMLKKSAASLICTTILLFAPMLISAQSNREIIHNIGKIPGFDSSQEITNFFAKANVPIQAFELKEFKNNNYVLAAFPYSGNNTIDLYYFVKFGDKWDVKMLYFYLNPKYRELRVEENQGQIIVFDRKEEIIRLTVDKTLASP